MKAKKLEVKFERSSDSFWSWIVCLSSFFLQFTVGGVSSSFGSFFIPLLDEFGRSEAETAWIGSLAIGLTYLCGPLSTNLCHRMGCRVVACTGSVLFMAACLLTSIANNMMLMYLTFGVLGGISFSMMYFASMISLIEYFNKHLSLANGIAVSGAGTGTLVVSLLSETVCSRYGVRVGFRTISGLAVVGFIAGLAYAPIHKDSEALEDWKSNDEKSSAKKSGSKWRSLLQPGPQWKNKAFVVWTLALALILFAYYIPYVYLVRVAKINGVPTSKGALLVGFMAISQTVGKILFGRLADVPNLNRLLLGQISLLVIAVATCLFPLATSYGAFVAYSVVQGFFDGGFVVMLGLITYDIVGKELMAGAVGSMYGVVAIPMTVGPPTAGFIYDLLGSYNAVYFLGSGLICAGVCLTFLVPLLAPSTTDSLEEKLVLVSESEEYKNDNSKDGEISSADEQMKADLLGKDNGADLLLERNRALLEYRPETRPSSFVLFSIVTDDSHRDISAYTSRLDLHVDHSSGINTPFRGTPSTRRRIFDPESHASTFSLRQSGTPGSCLDVKILEPIADHVATEDETAILSNHVEVALETVKEYNDVKYEKICNRPQMEIPQLGVLSISDEDVTIVESSSPSCISNDDILKEEKRLSNSSWNSAGSNDSWKSSSQQSTGTNDSGFEDTLVDSISLESEDLTKFATDVISKHISNSLDSEASECELTDVTETTSKNSEDDNCDVNNYDYHSNGEVKLDLQLPYLLENCTCSPTDPSDSGSNIVSESEQRTNFGEIEECNSTQLEGSDNNMEYLDYYSLMFDYDLECVEEVNTSFCSSNLMDDTCDIKIPEIAKIGLKMNLFTETVI